MKIQARLYHYVTGPFAKDVVPSGSGSGPAPKISLSETNSKTTVEDRKYSKGNARRQVCYLYKQQTINYQQVISNIQLKKRQPAPDEVTQIQGGREYQLPRDRHGD